MLCCSALLYRCLSICIFLRFLIFFFYLQEHLSLPLVSHYLVAHMHCTFCASSFYALCAMSIQCTIPLLYISVVAHSSFYTPESLSIIAPISSLFCLLIVSVHLVHPLCAMLLHSLHVECSAFSSLQLFNFSGC
jgi:formate-dependent nitrite reductase membrane component NrfD